MAINENVLLKHSVIGCFLDRASLTLLTLMFHSWFQFLFVSSWFPEASEAKIVL